MATVAFRLNGVEVSAEAGDGEPLLYVLRNRLGCTSVKFGCGLEQCGCCAVLVDGEKRLACTLAADAVAGKSVETVEGMGSAAAPGPIQAAFLAEQAGQCGYCLSGMLIATRALLERTPKPSRDQIIEALDDHLCRCGTHHRIVRAVERAAEAGS